MNYISFQEDKISIFNPTKPKKSLILTYHPFSIRQVDEPKVDHPDINFQALLGVKIIDDIPFLLIASESKTVSMLRGCSIYEIKKIDWIPVIVPSQAEEVLIKCEQTFSQISKLFDEGYHYYSDHYQLNMPFLNNEIRQPSKEQSKFYDQFIWNKKIKRTQNSSVLEQWSKSIIQGYVQSFTTILPSHETLKFHIISRRSNKKAGTRYYSRGIDDEGNVANFTQTQQIIEYESFVFTHLQIRGSVPAFFEQVGISGISGELNIARNQVMTEKAFNLHFDSLQKMYSKIFCINLLSVKKSDEEKLTNFFQSMVSKYPQPYVKYEYFDFHNECKNNEFENSRILVAKIHDVVCSFGYNIFHKKTKEILGLQNGVVRTNCMDCLDRTNYIQSRLGLLICQEILKKFSQLQFRQKLNEFQLFVNKHEQSSILLKNFNKAWGDNGDSISLHYTGIGSTHTDITKNGKRTFAGTVNHKMRSLMRFFTQFTDTKKHQAITRLVKTSSIKTQFFENKEIDFMNVVILSYQINKGQENKINKEFMFAEEYVGKKNPAIIVVFAYMHANSNWLKNIFHKSEDIKYFAEEKSYGIKKQGYEMIDKLQNDEACLLIFAKKELIKQISQIKHQIITKHKDLLLITKFTLHQSPMAFSGMRCSSFDHFKELLDKSHDEAFQTNKLGKAKSSSILAHNYRTVMGNISSKIDFSEDYMRDVERQLEWMKQKGDDRGQLRVISQILDKDEFSRGAHHENTRYLRNYMQGPISFLPSCNRIIFWNMENLIIKVLDYGKNKEQRCTYGEYSYEICKKT